MQSVSADWEKTLSVGLRTAVCAIDSLKKWAVANEGKGLESAARQARYIAFEEQLAAYSASRPQDNSNISYSAEADSVLLMGHHANDQAETLLMRLFRGAVYARCGGHAHAALAGEITDCEAIASLHAC